MAARVQIIVEAKDASSGVLRAITGQLGAFGGLMEELTAKNVNWGNVTERAASLVIDAFKESIRATQEYAQEVRDLSLAGDMTAESASRMLQVLDDYQLTAEDAKAATKALTREGLAPSIETIAQISEEYLKLNNVEERNALVQKKLGRAGQEWLNLLSQGPDKIRAMNEAVNESLILSQKDLEEVEKYRLSLDQLSDTWQGIQIQFGTSVIPRLNDLLSVVNDNAEAGKNWQTVIELLAASSGGFALLTKDLSDAHNENTDALQQETAALDQNKISMEAAAAAAKETTQYYQGLISSIQSAQAETDRYTEKEAELLEKKRQLNAELYQTTKQYGANSKQVKDIQADLADLDKELQKNEDAHKKWAAQTVFSFAMARAAADGNITKGEGEMLIQIGQQLDLFDKDTADTMRSVNDAFDSLDTSNAQDSVKTLETSLRRLTGKEWVIKIVTDTSGVSLPAQDTGPTSTCFVAGTKILTPSGERSIEDIQPGDKIVSYDTKLNKQIVTTVRETKTHSPSEMGYCYLQINQTGVTKDHLMFCKGDWVRAESLKVGDELLNPEGLPVNVSRIRSVYKRVRTYNLHTDHETHNYFADGVLVHNYKQAGGTVYAGRPQVVGEGGAEPFIPAVNGRILGHSESLHALAGGNNYFYGNVTISPGSETGGDLLNIR